MRGRRGSEATGGVAQVGRDVIVGSERLLYGSDFCWTPDPLVLAQIRSIDAAPQPDGTTWRDLTSRNAGRLFGAGV